MSCDVCGAEASSQRDRLTLCRACVGIFDDCSPEVMAYRIREARDSGQDRIADDLVTSAGWLDCHRAKSANTSLAAELERAHAEIARLRSAARRPVMTHQLHRERSRESAESHAKEASTKGRRGKES